MTREKLIEHATEGDKHADVLQMAEHLIELFWPDCEWFTAGHARFLQAELKRMYSRWYGGKTA